MATAIGTDTVSTIARRHILPTIVDAIYGSNVLFYRMVKSNKKMIQGGVHIEQPVNYARSGLGGAYSGYEQLSTAAFDVLQAAVVRAGLVDALNGRNQLTVFAPTDAAFVSTLGAANEAARRGPRK